MRLFLSSYGAGNQPDKLLELLHDNNKVAVITNAGDCYSEEGTLEHLEKNRAFFKALGLETERLDLRNYFDDNGGLKTRLLEYGLIWVPGGNSFLLRRAMKQSGFDELIVELLAKNQIVYGGFSAGACMLSPTLRGVDLCDDPSIIAEGYDSEIIWDGLGLVDFSIAPHYKSDHPESAIIDRVVEYFEHKNMPFKALRDGEAIVINGNKTEFIK